MDYDSWLSDVDNSLWALLGAALDEFDDVDFETLYNQNMEPEEVARYVYDEEEG